MTIHVRGRVVPYEVANAYNETFRRGALREFAPLVRVALDAGHPMPMLWGHVHPVGYWTSAEDRADGLYATGVVTSRAAERRIRRGVHTVSISFVDGVGNDREARHNAGAQELFGNRPGYKPEYFYKPHRVDSAVLGEISFTDSPAFGGTNVVEYDPGTASPIPSERGRDAATRPNGVGGESRARHQEGRAWAASRHDTGERDSDGDRR